MEMLILSTVLHSTIFPVHRKLKRNGKFTFNHFDAKAISPSLTAKYLVVSFCLSLVGYVVKSWCLKQSVTGSNNFFPFFFKGSLNKVITRSVFDG